MEKENRRVPLGIWKWTDGEVERISTYGLEVSNCAVKWRREVQEFFWEGQRQSGGKKELMISPE